MAITSIRVKKAKALYFVIDCPIVVTAPTFGDWWPACLAFRDRFLRHGGDRKAASKYMLRTAFGILFSSGRAWTAVAISIALQPSLDAANLKSVTVQAWDKYIETASAEMQQRLSSDSVFLW